MIKTKSVFTCLAAVALALVTASCHHMRGYAKDTPPRAVVRDGVAITVCDQKLTVYRDGKKVKDYDVSTSKFGLGSTHGSRRTPLGIHAVSHKTGDGQPKGMVFKGARPTGEVVAVDAEGRDPVVTRVIQLAGLEESNKNSHSRRIYIHGTPEERFIGRPASYGCIRMRSDDVVDLFGRVHRGMPVVVESCSQKTYMAAQMDATKHSIVVPEAIVANLPTDRAARLRPVSRSSRSRRLATSRKGKGNPRAALASTGKKSGATKRLAYRKSGKKRRG